jgi:hypothetical protein
MRQTSRVTGLLVLAASALPLLVLAQQPKPRSTPMVGMQPTAKPEMLEIYQIDLVPSGSAFALNKPVLENNSYVFKVWPERDIVHLRKEKVRKITPRTQALEKYAVYQVEMVPSGRLLARDMPTLKNNTYVFHTWKENKLMALRLTDVKGIEYLQGLPAFRAQQEEKGAALIGNLPMEGASSVTYFSEPPAEPSGVPVPAAAPPPSNWIYDGIPGATTAFAPSNAVIERPGDPPKAPNP